MSPTRVPPLPIVTDLTLARGATALRSPFPQRCSLDRCPRWGTRPSPGASTAGGSA